MAQAEVALLQCALFFFYSSVCLCQLDCTGTNCPLLDNCIEEVLERGACCASCLQKGCACEGYQYYDCVSAGFKNGKVPEGDSYFVDYGSTECSCPVGGGRISCHFISCPDMPPNCIDVSEPADGCMQCERVGCVHDGQKFEAGHSFHIDPCRVCHCPNEGGKLMCYPVPDCDLQKVHKPMLAAPTEDNTVIRHDNFPYRFDQQGHTDQYATPYHLPNGNLPLFKLSPLDKEEPEDYDYGPTDFPETYPQSLLFPTPSSSSFKKVLSVSQGSVKPDRISSLQSFDRQGKQALRERYGVRDHPSGREEVTESPLRLEQTTNMPNMHATSSWQFSQGLTSLQGVLFNNLHPQTDLDDSLHGHKSLGSGIFPLHRELESEKHTEYPHAGSESTIYPQRGTETKAHNKNTSDSVAPRGSISQTNVSLPERGTEIQSSQERGSDTVHFPLYTMERSEVPVHPEANSNGPKEMQKLLTVYDKERLNKEEMQGEKQEEIVTFQNVSGPEGKDVPYTIDTLQQERSEEDSESSIPTSIYEKTTSEPVTPSQRRPESLTTPVFHFITTTQPPMRVTLEESQPSGEPNQMVINLHSEGRQEEKEGVKEVEEDRPALPIKPEEVSDSKFPKEAFSISSTDEAANTVEEQEDVDECELYPGQLCQHTCTNIWGSYRCGCHQGYILQLDGHSCAPVSSKEDNGLREVDAGPAFSPTTTTTKTATTTTSSFSLNPCADNGGCSQQCTAVAGRARCSCFPGFSLMTDGWMCEDVDECMTGAHSCKPSQRCVNTVGSFVCELQVTCPAGYQLRNSLCEDIDECTMRTHNCGMGFVCENTVGSFLCNPKQKCISGFTQDSHGNCIDINECSSLSEPCSSGFNCINTVGSYTCQKKIVMCSHGYHASPDGAKCVDTDECQMETHRCGAGQICHNLPGSYRCDCQTGYQYNALRKVCTDVNECWRYSGRLCAQKCENTPGSYRCSCTAGFSLAFDGKNCEDTNECEQNPCSQECANIYGSYQCYCRPGYYLKDDGHTCEDIDECSQSIGNLCAFQCVNTAGSYQCACPPHGYVMAANGRTCKDIDECTAGTHNCSTRQTCYNLQGGFRCLSFDCPQHYKKVSNTRCERINCPASSLDCKNSPLWITYYQLTYETNIIIPAQIFRIGPNPAYSGDHIVISITKGNEEGYFSTRKLNSFTGAVYLQRKVREPKDFLIDVEMKLLRQGTFTSFLAKIHVFITPSTM
uniref:Fibulin 2 n=1 Tax=Oreochromis niloticus TaxID=8128 RepID=A0A669C070_ORENI